MQAKKDTSKQVGFIQYNVYMENGNMLEDIGFLDKQNMHNLHNLPTTLTLQFII